ncbi:hypothetical protein BC938DRAFT_471122 [Jimgerdemannia flammicorona]|uniref:Rhomboid-type serine protease n=1 Tax=Jimgerdemannia flammicorona TaxID=994334 RepID=A0A433Q8R9_9FUNG|nr:hypothetical protein BC938DRAFT_471122 [Jimgerdemannia flammicorona]
MATNRNPSTWSTWFSDNAGQPHQSNDVHASGYDASNDYTDRPQSFFPTRQQTNDTAYFDHTSSIPLSATPVSQQHTAYASTPSAYHYDTPTSPPLSSASPAPSSKPYPVSTGMTPALSSASPPTSVSLPASSATPYNGYDYAGSNAQLLDNSPTPQRSFTPTQDYGMPNNVAPEDEAYARALYYDEANKIYANQGPANPRDSTLAGNISPGAQDRLSRSNTPADPNGKAPLDPKVLAELDNRRKWRPWFCWSTALAMIAVLVYELIQNKAVTGNIIELNPPNIMVGPSANVLIGIGARFVPCMRLTQSFPVAGPYQCPNMTDVATTNTTNQVLCTLTDLCLLGGFKDPSTPDQWFRFITPIFLHGGVVHLLMNMLVQLRLGASLEREMGPFSVLIALVHIIAVCNVGFFLGVNFEDVSSTFGPSETHPTQLNFHDIL